MLVTLVKAAEMLGLSSTTLREQVHRGRFAATKIGRDWLVDTAEVERYRLVSVGQAGRPFNLGRRLEQAIQEIHRASPLGGQYVMEGKNRAQVALNPFLTEVHSAEVRKAAQVVAHRIGDIMTGPDQAKLNWEPLWYAWKDLERILGGK